MGTASIALAHDGGRLSDHELVTLARRGDERAFEVLYDRYQPRIGAFVLGLVKDHGRAEDITQEVFVSALRRMRATERPIAFKPWIYEIARNACIDAYRRGRRGEEISFEADDRLSAADRGRLVASQADPPSAVAAKQELDTVLGAFGGLTEAHHEILVLRELEGLSYAAIGERMGISRAGVESTLFRARKRLSEEYDDLASGARCLRVQGIIEANEGERLGTRDARRLARHVAHCQPCRRLALRAGFDVPARRGLGGRIAAWLPLPGSLRLGGWGTQRIAEALEPGWGKLAAGAAAILLAGAGTEAVISGAEGDPARPAATQRAAAADTGGAAAARAPLASSGRTTATPGGGRQAGARDGDDGRAGPREGARKRGGAGALATGGADQGGAREGGGGGDTRDGGGSAASGGGGGADGGSRSGGGGTESGGGGGGGSDPTDPVKAVTDPVKDTVETTTDTVQDTVQDVTQTVDQTVDDVQQVVQDPATAVPQVGATVNETVDGATDAVDEVADGATGTVGGLLP